MKKEKLIKALTEVPEDLLEAAYLVQLWKGDFQIQLDYNPSIVKAHLLDATAEFQPNGFVEAQKSFGETSWQITMT
ncbi:MAG: hypothetical protein J7J52_04825 [Deltaproteobacteria bacterium]|nr:hypothetical protein [Deltaproteobacteria bacterium]